jgi:hypothetical protein
MRKVVSALTVAAGLTLLASPGQADEGDYPPGPEERLTVSESTVSPGEGIVVSGSGAEAGATVAITLTRSSSSSLGAGSRMVAANPTLARLVAASRPLAQGSVMLGRTTTDAAGDFRTTVIIPSSADSGVYFLVASSGGEVLAVVSMRMVAGATASGLPFTGGNVVPGLALGAGLIVAGGLLLFSVRRRRRSVTV